MKKILLLAIVFALCSDISRAQQRGVAPASPMPMPAQEDYAIGPQDVLNITVWDNADLTGKYTVQPDGTVTIPLLGRTKAAGMSLRKFEAELTKALSEGFLKEPNVAVTLDQYRGRRIFVFGAVSSPGTYALPEGQTLIEALVRAGYGGASQVVIVRPKQPSGPTMPEEAGDAEVIRVNLKELEKDVEHGSLARNIPLRDGDTIFIPRTDPTRIFVSGQVRSPGAYSITENTTVLQAIALAGGVTESAAVNRLRIMRLVDGKQKSFKVQLSDLVQPGDTLIVPERYF
jgi:polysaccharide biosynthesis/export protein